MKSTSTAVVVCLMLSAGQAAGNRLAPVETMPLPGQPASMRGTISDMWAQMVRARPSDPGCTHLSE
jgi:hypothetical protein